MTPGRDKRPLHPDSVAVVAGRPSEVGEPVNWPVTLASTYRAGGRRIYAREGNPTWDAFETALGELEGGTAIAFGSGMAAAAAVLEALPAAAPIVVSRVAYHGVSELVNDRVAAGRLEAEFVDGADHDQVASACEGAALLWLESPTNPLLDVVDLPALAEIGHSNGALVLVDNTFATPLRQRPLELGADVVLHSVTKFLGGHSDLLLGALVTADERLAADLTRRRDIDGAAPGAMEAFLALRGVRTLAVRLDRAERTAMELATRLRDHAAVRRVRYPGLADDPGHELASRQMSGFGAVLAFETIGDASTADAVCERVELITHATSLGGVESLLERRAKYAGDELAGTPSTLIRLSVGLESADDLWADLERALEVAASS